MNELFILSCAFVTISVAALAAGAVEHLVEELRVRRRVKLVRKRVAESLARLRAEGAEQRAKPGTGPNFNTKEEPMWKNTAKIA